MYLGSIRSKSLLRHRTLSKTDRVLSDSLNNNARKKTEKILTQPCTYELIKTRSSSKELLKIFKSRQIPSQFFSTPEGLIEKMTENIYQKPDKLLSINTGTLPYTALVKSESKHSISALKTIKKSEKQDYLEKSCKLILEDTKKSRKDLAQISDYLEQNANFLNSLSKNLKKNSISSNTSEFHLKLKHANKLILRKTGNSQNGKIKPDDILKLTKLNL